MKLLYYEIYVKFCLVILLLRFFLMYQSIFLLSSFVVYQVSFAYKRTGTIKLLNDNFCMNGQFWKAPNLTEPYLIKTRLFHFVFNVLISSNICRNYSSKVDSRIYIIQVCLSVFNESVMLDLSFTTFDLLIFISEPTSLLCSI